MADSRAATVALALLGLLCQPFLEVQVTNLQDLSLVLGGRASISGRVVADSGVRGPLRIWASRTLDHDSTARSISGTVGGDSEFRIAGLSGTYLFTASTDRVPSVVATHIIVDGIESPATDGVKLNDGVHEVVIFVSPRDAARPAVDTTLSAGALVEQFKAEKVFWRQFTVAQAIVQRGDASGLESLRDWLGHEDRHVRGNVAFVFGGLGDPRGFQVIAAILGDRSDRPEGQGRPTGSSDGRYRVASQIRADRYYAAHLLGDLRDPRGVSILVSLLQDSEVNYIVPWALGQIGDRSAITPLLDVLDDENPSMRVLAIYALETLQAKEALPRLKALLNDHRTSNFGGQFSVAEAARAAIATLP
jgi:HEAT repeat protein